MRYSLKNYNTFHTNTKTKIFKTVNSVNQAIAVLNQYGDEKLLILGGGSNTLFVNDYDGVVIRPYFKGIELLKEDKEYAYIKVYSGENWDVFVRWCVEHNYAGIENMVMIPGSVGGAVAQNIGAYGQSVIDTLNSIEAIDISTKKLKQFIPLKCGYRYRGSYFKHEWKNKYIIVSAIFKLRKNTRNFELSYTERAGRYGSLKEELESLSKDPYSIQYVMKAVIMQRDKRLPSVEEYGTCGSFFENPTVSTKKYKELSKEITDLQSYPTEDREAVRIPAGRLLDELGWKGKWIGNVGTSEKHALCVVTNKKASGKEIYDFINEMKKSVYQKYGVKLIPEVNIII